MNVFNSNNDASGTNPAYYRKDYQDEIDLFLEYFTDPENSNWCYAEVQNIIWEYPGEDEHIQTNKNKGGFTPPNRTINQLDYTYSYKFKIIDVIEDYDTISGQDDIEFEPGTGNYNWWDILGFPEPWENDFNNEE